MHWRHDEKENLERLRLVRLRKEGFPEQTIARLDQLRRRYIQDVLDLPTLNVRRLTVDVMASRWGFQPG